MARGTFANIRLLNKFLNKQAPQTIHLPSGEVVSILSAALLRSQPSPARGGWELLPSQLAFRSSFFLCSSSTSCFGLSPLLGVHVCEVHHRWRDPLHWETAFSCLEMLLLALTKSSFLEVELN